MRLWACTTLTTNRPPRPEIRPVPFNCPNYVASSDSGAGGGEENEDDRVTKWAYNGLGQITELTAVNVTSSGTVNQVTEYKYTDPYDASLVRLTKYPDGNTSVSGSPQDNVQMTYNLDGSPATRTDQRGVVIEYVYNDRRQVTIEKATTIPSSVYGGNSESDAARSILRAFDSQGRVTDVFTMNSSTLSGDILNHIHYSYGTHGKVSQIDQDHADIVGSGAAHQTVTFTHDVDQTDNVYTDGLRVTHVGYPAATAAQLVSSYSSSDSVTDRLHRPVYQKLWGGAALNGNEAHTSWYQYNGVSSPVGVWTEQTSVEREMYSTSGDYDALDRFGRTVSQSWKNRSSGNVLDQVDYTYDYAGNRTSRDVPVELIISTGDEWDQKYTYDGLHRLTNSEQGSLSFGSITGRTFEQDWSLDQLGNWSDFDQDDNGDGTWDVEQVRTHNKANELTGFTSPGSYTDPAHDDSGNMTTIPRPGAPTASFALKYDAWNRLIEVSDSGTIATYEYDGFGQRIRKVVAGGATHDYYYNDRWQLLTEVKNGSVEAIYHWHPFYIDALAVRMRSNDTHFFLQDANFNVTAAVDDATNAVVERYAYSPYGEVTILDDDFTPDSVSDDGLSDIDNNHLYTGRERDVETGLQLNRHRYYASHLGRWVNRDPILYWGGMNLYWYVGGMPTYYVDSLGLEPSEVPYRDETGRIHDPVPNEVPKDWGEETIDEALGEADGSIAERQRKGIEHGGMDSGHGERLNREKNWRKKLLSRRDQCIRAAKKGAKKIGKKIIGPAFIIVDAWTGGPIYAFNEVTWPASEFWRDDGFFDGPDMPPETVSRPIGGGRPIGGRPNGPIPLP